MYKGGNWQFARGHTNGKNSEPSAAPIIIGPRKSKPGAPSAEIVRLVIDY